MVLDLNRWVSAFGEMLPQKFKVVTDYDMRYHGYPPLSHPPPHTLGPQDIYFSMFNEPVTPGGSPGDPNVPVFGSSVVRTRVLFEV